MSQNVPTLSEVGRETKTDLATGWSEVAPAEDWLGTLEVLCMVAPNEAYKRYESVLTQEIYPPADI
jgi:hypothetical protein